METIKRNNKGSIEIDWRRTSESYEKYNIRLLNNIKELKLTVLLGLASTMLFYNSIILAILLQ